MTGKELGKQAANSRPLGHIPNSLMGVHYNEAEPGMTKREAFAMAAMQGLCSDRDEAGNLVKKGHTWIAEQSVKCADALLDQLADNA